jgi:hypothetical protein
LITNLPAGYKIPAGLGHATVLASLDFETYSAAGFYWNATKNKYVAPKFTKIKGLPSIGMHRYAEHYTTEVLCAAYDLKDGRGKRMWKPGDPNPVYLFRYLSESGLLEAWNAPFEFLIWNYVCVRYYGWPLLHPNSIRCAAAKSRAFGLPGSLDPAGRVLDIENKKLKDGMRLITKFSMPRNPSKKDARHRIL